MKFIPYVCCGDPSLDFSFELVKMLAPHSDIIELGIPFSDPIADGKTIQAAANRALKNGTKVDGIFAMVGKLRKEEISVPFVFMTYYNIIYAHGRERFLERMKEVDVQGLIIPDLPFGEDTEFENMAEKLGIAIINIIATNTPEERAKKILDAQRMFTYLVPLSGVTGARDEVKEEGLEFVQRIRKLAGEGKKLGVGFGISKPEHAKEFLDAGADAIIVGSRIVDIYSDYMDEKGQCDKDALGAVEEFAKKMKND